MGGDLMKIKGTGNDQWYDGRRNSARWAIE